ncbi:DUF2854 domain-containing protein [Pseudanabaena sp. PCC 6802]|uniref:DUF2854 domain-containing protein n=1 Tax=Pseudanabaena sp. PCC 6802 TaxID=118173 RepID=UPI000348D22F|nr:DUF2854 domain-containing protein [Pseudanabaena sp. PCC 6802]
MLRQISLSSVFLLIGIALSAIGVYAYATGNPTLNLAGFFYGIPILLGGAALKSAEVKPSQFLYPSSDLALKLRDTQATPTQIKVRQDVTRYRYGIRAHLDAALEKLGMSPTNEERPVLAGIYEEVFQAEGQPDTYSLVLRFQSPLIGLETWQEKQEKIGRFFGPGVIAQVTRPEVQSEIPLVDLRLISAIN